MAYLPRTLEPVLLRRAREFPVVLVTGPRQSGKTTLLRRAFPRARYVALEAGDVRAAAEADPRGLLAGDGPLILDEVQHVPALLDYVQEAVDARRGSKGRFLLTASQNLLLLERVTQTLAGRVAILTLLPLSLREQLGRPRSRPAWEGGRRLTPSTVDEGELWRRIVRGGYPELVASPGRPAEPWLESYVQTYLERDVRLVRQVGDLRTFDAFLRLLAARSATFLDLSALSRELGVAVNTVKAWLSVLEATWQVALVRPWAGNLGKRLVRSPKVYLLDTGLMAHLTGFSDPEQARRGPLAGALFETAVLVELLRAAHHAGRTPRVHVWRTATGHEVDFLVEHAAGLVPLEAKATSTPRPEHAVPITRLAADGPPEVLPGFVVHAGRRAPSLGGGVKALPLAAC